MDSEPDTSDTESEAEVAEPEIIELDASELHIAPELRARMFAQGGNYMERQQPAWDLSQVFEAHDVALDTLWGPMPPLEDMSSDFRSYVDDNFDGSPPNEQPVARVPGSLVVPIEEAKVGSLIIPISESKTRQ